jgi:hypothetical protein
MNERIQELAYLAEEYADSIVDQGGEFHETYTKKLAELIVKEYEQFLPEICPWANADEEGPMRGWHVCFVARKHFGLE